MYLYPYINIRVTTRQQTLTYPFSMKAKPTIKLKPKQIEILLLLYRFRFLNRNQIQKLMSHKHFNRVIVWLNELANEKYIVRDYNRRLAGKPSVYFLGTGGRKVLMEMEDIKKSLLERVYQEKRTSQAFREHCMLIAEIYMSLLSLVEKNNAKLNFYTKNELSDIKYLVLPHPDIYFSIEQKSLTKRYFLDVFDSYSSGKWLFKRVQQHIHYFEENYWQDHNPNPFPEILFVYQEEKTMKILETLVRKRTAGYEGISFSLVSGNDIRLKGISRELLRRVL